MAPSRKEKLAEERAQKKRDKERRESKLRAESDFSLRPHPEWPTHIVRQVQSTRFLPYFIYAPVLWFAPISYLKFVFWLLLLGFFAEIDFGTVFVLFSGFYLVFTNFGRARKKGELSPYSVFNDNFENMEGTLTQAQLEKEMMRKMY
ncbi:hypothetical protein SARC_06084 [Sphaeroforma arctica JP610]|uniref:SAYSvFN domain-containing protein n=1 Tax=Sphaeroforma arctica JP610 TaxID=667725 RepID=A0A0L0FYI5_9EUKA|nr:hypothetical protein SARC_06084 [Sphaeroforma arctica JP610]KNC81606.1 hypothetical protein SARC_06084 [Sphaeroforma arctica JP610]|eukprot:XP_014155508.1 hypothetical protein SARC_06084 [Sphaeroforma arctica JP610]